MSTVTISTESTTQRETVLLPPIATAFSSDAELRGNMPLFVPRDQAYFWTHQWQEAEAEALREIAAGQVKQFEGGLAAVAWLLSEEH
jgi:hypothetical protein